MRAVLNFPISDLRFPRSFICALGQIKQAAAQVNVELDLLDGEIARADHGLLGYEREVGEHVAGFVAETVTTH